MSEIAKTLVDKIQDGQLQDAKDSINDGIKQKAAEVVDMKRVEMQVDWMSQPQEG